MTDKSSPQLLDAFASAVGIYAERLEAAKGRPH